MKYTSLLLLLLLGAGTMAMSQKTTITIKVAFKSIQDGYDHDTKTKVFIDSVEVAESPVHKQSKAETLTVPVPTGNHAIRIMTYALYEGNWEEHTIANDYSQDCMYEAQHTFSKKETLYLIFDLTNGTRFSWSKPIK